MFEFITHNLLWTESPSIVAVLLVAGFIGWFFYKPLFFVTLLLFLFCFYFFRNPERVCPEALIDPTVLVCPADGTIVDISYDPNGGFSGYHHKVSIFLSPFNVHVNWIPLAGTIQKIDYIPGKFMMAFLPKSSELNEHNDVTIATADGKTILLRQIAGTVARRIVCWVREGQSVTAGQKYGMIKFSSRVDVLLPKDIALAVKVGQKVYGGKTVFGRLL
jgi:phosphatidylserine decarboxylase